MKIHASNNQERPEASPSQFNKGGSIYKPLINGIDTLVMGFYVSEFNLSEDDWKMLSENKERAKSTIFKTAGIPVKFKSKEFTLRPAGKPPYTYVLVMEDITVKIALRPSNGKFPEILVEFRSQFLWRGYIDAYLLITEWIKTWAFISAEIVSVVHLTLDIQGQPDIVFENIVTKSRKKRERYEVFSYGKEITGYEFGSSPLKLIIYNKAKEIKTSHKFWFYDLWLKKRWDGGAPVFRVEYHLGRKMLKDFQIESFKDLRDTIPDMWRYLTQEWFTLRVKNNNDSNKTRWPLDPFWITVQKALSRFGNIVGVERERIKEVKAEVLIPQAIGLISSVGALSGKNNFEESVREINIKGSKHLKRKGKHFNDLLYEKKKKYAFYDDGEGGDNEAA
ncbi:MAG: hypothetical protein QMD44_08280 [Thermodesulfovibrionales bacterium]|jgi:hypothetical protein|nr:hypothetical protein [Thermodesulfovibrionales bacterium]